MTRRKGSGKGLRKARCVIREKAKGKGIQQARKVCGVKGSRRRR